MFEFDRQLVVHETDLSCILTFSEKFQEFHFTNVTYTGSIANLDYHLITGLSRATQLTELHLAFSTISSLCFMQFLPNLEVVDLSDCRNLCDADFKVIYHCKKLEFLNLSFNFINVSTIAAIVTDKPHLCALEIYGIGVTIADCHTILCNCYKTLDYFYLSLSPFECEAEFYDMIHNHYIDLNAKVFQVNFKDFVAELAELSTE